MIPRCWFKFFCMLLVAIELCAAHPIPILEPTLRVPDAVSKERHFKISISVWVSAADLVACAHIFFVSDSQFAMRAIRAHFRLDAAWDFEQILDGKVETSQLSSTRAQLKQVERESIDARTGEMRRSLVYDYVPVETHHRIDTETTLLLKLVRDGSKPVAEGDANVAPIIISVGVSHDANEYASLQHRCESPLSHTRLLVAQFLFAYSSRLAALAAEPPATHAFIRRARAARPFARHVN